MTTRRREESLDRLQAMIQQERRHYQCDDYLQVEEPSYPVCTPLHVVAELSFLVTDTQLAPVTSPTSHNHPYALASPSHVSKFPSPRTSIDNLCSMEPSMSMSSCQSQSSSSSYPSAMQLSYLSSWRHEMISWAYNVTTIYQMDPEVVAVAVDLVDRYAAAKRRQTEPVLSKEDFQLVSMVSLYIAVKSLVPVYKLTVSHLMDMSRGVYDESDILRMEESILTVLDWHVNPPTVMDYCRLYLNVMSPPPQAAMAWESSCHCSAEISLDDDFFISKPKSLVALAIVLLTLQRQKAMYGQIESLLQGLQGLVNIQDSQFDAVLGRLESLC